MKQFAKTLKRAAVAVALVVAGLGGIGTFSPVIELWSMNDQVHTFGYWEKGYQAYVLHEPPIRILEIPIDPAIGNYIENPGMDDMAIFLGECVLSPETMTLEHYRATISTVRGWCTWNKNALVEVNKSYPGSLGN